MDGKKETFKPIPEKSPKEEFLPLHKYVDLPPAPKKKDKPEEKVERGVSEVNFTVDCTVDHNVL